MADGTRSQVLVTGAAGFMGLRVVRMLPGAVHDVFSIGRHAHPEQRGAMGYKPEHDLKAGSATVWPEFSETAK